MVFYSFFKSIRGKRKIEKAKTQFETITKQQHNELVRGAIELSEIRDEQEIVKDNLKDINKTYDKLKLLLNRKQSAKQNTKIINHQRRCSLLTTQPGKTFSMFESFH